VCGTMRYPRPHGLRLAAGSGGTTAAGGTASRMARRSEPWGSPGFAQSNGLQPWQTACKSADGVLEVQTALVSLTPLAL
jgi:hypothetical protein